MIRFLDTMAAANFIPHEEGKVRFVLPSPFGGSFILGEAEAEGAKTLWQSIFRCFLFAGHACALIGLIAPLPGCGLLLSLFVLWIFVIVSIQEKCEPGADDQREQRDWVYLQRSQSISRRQASWLRNAAWIALVLCGAFPTFLTFETYSGLNFENMIGLSIVSAAWMRFFSRILSSPKAEEYWAQSTGH